MGGPGGPGGSPMLSPGGGAGNKAAATQQVKAVIPALLMASMAFESGSKEQQSLLRAIQSLNPIFGKAERRQHGPGGPCHDLGASKRGRYRRPPPPGLVSNNTPPRHGRRHTRQKLGTTIMTEYLRPKSRVGNLSTRQMEDGIFRNPPALYGARRLHLVFEMDRSDRQAHEHRRHVATRRPDLAEGQRSK
jgi:hypothetical protein